MATKRSCCCCIRFSCFSSSSSDEKEQDHPTSGAGARSSPSATDNTIETPPGAQAPIPGSSNVVTPMKNEIEHVDVGINVSGTHPGGKAPVSESLRKSEGKNVNVNLNVPESPQCNEASSSGSSNVPDRSDREDVNANLNVSRATQCDEAPSSGSPNVPGKSEGEGVDANLNVSGAPLSNEAPSSSSSTSTSRVATKSDVIDTILHKDIVQTDGKNVAVNLDDLMKHISELLKLREEEMRQGKKLPNPSSNFSWPNVPGFKKLNAILSLTDLKMLTELLSSGSEVASKLKDIISGPVTELLKGIGQASVFTAGLLVVANTLERFQDLSANKEKCWDLIKEMSYFATIVKRFTESPRGTQEDVIQDAVTLIVEGAILYCTHIDRSAWKSFLLTSKDKDDLSDMRQKLDLKYKQIDIEIGLRLSTDIERVFAAIAARNSPLSNEYPKHAVGIEESIEEVMKLLECDNEKNVVTVILHGFGGIGKTTLADAVFSKVEGCKYSKVQLFKDIDSKPDIVKLQEDILKDLMEPQESVQIRKYEDGQKELGKILKKRHAFIYIDNVLDQVELEHLLPESEDLHEAKKVRFLLTARDKNAKLAFPSSVSTEIYDMKGIKNPQAARSILEKETLEGLDSRKVDQIIKKCDGLPLLLKLVARFIGHARDKGAAYDKLMQEEEIWNNEKFKEMSLRLAYDALPEKCKDPFLDICSYFRRWDWDTVENIVGKNELEMLENRALVTKDTFTGVVNVHDVILELGMSKGKEVRLTFSSARELMAYLEEKKEDAEGIKGIWLSGNKDVLQISASTLDSMHKSLRVLQLGNLTEAEGKCSKIFEELVFFEAKVPQLPFHDMSKFKQLRYLSYAPNELKLSKVQKLMLPGKLICLYRGGDDDEQVMYSRWNALEQQQRDRIHIIHLGRRRMASFEFTKNIKKDYYYPLKNTAEIEGMSSLNLSENEILRFSLRLCHLEEEINRMEDSELKFLLHSFQERHYTFGSIAFMDGAGKVVAALGGKILESIFDRKDKAQRFIKSIMNDIEGGGKEMHDEDPGVSDSLIQNLQTASTSVAVEQENMDAYFESLREYISDLWGMELYQHFRFNKEGKKRSLPSVTWPTSRGFCRLKNFLSEGISDDWVKEISSRHPEEEEEEEEEDQQAIVIHGLLKDIEEAQWAVAGLLAVADVLERFQTISADGMEYLSILWEMSRMAQYIKQFDQKPGFWRGVNRVATAIILAYSFHCCSQIDQSKFALFSESRKYAEWPIRYICEEMARAITEGPSNESESLLWKMCRWFPGFNFGFFLESGDDGGPSCESESDVYAVDAGSTATYEGGPSCEGESDVSAVEAGSTATTREEE